MEESAPAPVIEIDPIDNNTVYVGVGRMVHSSNYRSNRVRHGICYPGADWGGPNSDRTSSPINDSILYVSGTTGYAKAQIKEQLAKHWTWDLRLFRNNLAVDPSLQIQSHRNCSSSNYTGGIYKSTDGGKSWQ